MRDLRKMDKILLLLVIVFSIFGLIMIFSASSASTILRYNVTSSHFFWAQLKALLLAYIGGIVILFIPTKKFKLLSYIASICVGGLLLYVLVSGKVTNNAISWIKIGPLTIQPSEFAKSVTILFMAYFYNFLTRNECKKLLYYFVPLVVAFTFAFLIIKESDWGTALILLAISILIFISVPFVKKNFKKIFKYCLLGGVIIGIILVCKWDSIMTKEKMSRFNFLNPCERYDEDSGYQTCNGFIAIANGGLFGVGLGKSSQKYLYLPESHTDFIFPIICEELGAITGTIIIICYGILLLRILKIAKQADNLRNSIIAYGVFWYFIMHILVNLMGVLALIPLTGVPLPFLSYGGSYALNVIIMIFFVERISIENKKSAFSREMANL